MTATTQAQQRTDAMSAILRSRSRKRIIIAGAGTGKTFTFKKILQPKHPLKSVALTFIKVLADDMKASFGHIAKTQTLHGFCKRLLHTEFGAVHLAPYLGVIIEEDAALLGKHLTDFDKKFQELADHSREVKFFLERSAYYEAVSFNDYVYRSYQLIKAKPGLLPHYNHILIDEYQDFNLLEVNFIEELMKRGKVLIVGDDDQAVYDKRNSSPHHLRDLYADNSFRKFELPFCTRCTEVVVHATNNLIAGAVKNKNLQGRVNKRFECFLDKDKIADNAAFPQLLYTEKYNLPATVKYINKVIASVTTSEIEQSWKNGGEYPTVLVIGPRDYLPALHPLLKDDHPQLQYKESSQPSYTVRDGYKLLLRKKSSNLGWRILLKKLSSADQQQVLLRSKNKSIKAVLPEKFKDAELDVLKWMGVLKKKKVPAAGLVNAVKKTLGKQYEEIKTAFTPPPKRKRAVKLFIDRSKVSIRLSSFPGCKGLSASRVIILGVNEGAMPEKNSEVSDTEICQFLVALTRTRKECHLVATKKGRPSIFLDWIGPGLIRNA